MTVVLWIVAWFGASILLAAAHHAAKRTCQKRQRRTVMPPTPHQQIVQQVIEEHLAWSSFVQAHEWPGSCPDCVWWVHDPAEAEDAIAVYRPCPRHDPVYGPEQEKKAGQ